MGATDSKLQFKNHVFRLFECSNISASDTYWTKFWTEPNSAYDVFTLFTALDIRKTRDSHLENLETLLTVVSNRMFQLYDHRSFPHPEFAPAKEMLNCLRILSRVLPYIYEQRSDPQIREWEHKFFWSVSDNSEAGTVAPLGQRLADTAFDLLFYSRFTVPHNSGSRAKVVHYIWETGVGCTTPLSINHEHISNRVEVLRFLLALSSDVMYYPSGLVAAKGSKAITHMVTKTNKHHAMAILCSLLNITLKYSSGWKVPYEHVLISDRNRQLVIYSVQFLLVLLTYTVPSEPNIEEEAQSVTQGGETPKNIYRQLLSRIHKSQDLQFIADSLTKLLTQPILASNSYLPGSRREIQWINELTILFWEFILCNKKFKSYLVSSTRVHDFTILILYYIYEQRLDPSKREHVRLCAYILQNLSSDVLFATSLSKRFESYSNLPLTMKLSSFNGTYGDYYILQLFKTVTASGENLSFLIRTLLVCIYNISPYIINLSYQTASSMVQLFANLSTASFINSSDYNQSLLRLVLKSLIMMVTCNYRSNKNLMYIMVKNKDSFETLEKVIHESLKSSKSFGQDDGGNNKNSTDQSQFVIEDQDHDASDNENNDYGISDTTNIVNVSDIASPSQQQQKSHIVKSKGKQKLLQEKQPEDSLLMTNNRFGEEWALLDPLLTIIKYVSEKTQYNTPIDLEGKLKSHAIIDNIANLSQVPSISSLTPHEPLPNEFRPENFKWSASSLGWYESVLWGFIYTQETHIEVNAPFTDATTINDPVASSVGLWNSTNIKLFKLQEIAVRGPSLLRPKGAVDAVADSVFQKFSQLATSSRDNRDG